MSAFVTSCYRARKSPARVASCYAISFGLCLSSGFSSAGGSIIDAQREKPQNFRVDSDRFPATLIKGTNRLSVRVGAVLSESPIATDNDALVRGASLDALRLLMDSLGEGRGQGGANGPTGHTGPPDSFCYPFPIAYGPISPPTARPEGDPQA